MKLKYLKFIIPVFIIFVIVFPSRGIIAAMKSDNYIIYENVMHTFDGPIISGVTASVSGNSATVTWITDIVADAFVIYDTNSGFSTSKEQGSSAKSGTSHSVAVSGLEYSTTYYYRVRSERINGGITTDITSRTFTTGAAPADPTTPDPGGGGGILIIDKTDTIPPIISNIIINSVTDITARISWTTDEEATSFIEYGTSVDYGNTYGQWEEVLEHSVGLINLNNDSGYRFRVVSSDDWGNVSYSDDYAFTTVKSVDDEEDEIVPEPEPDDEEPDDEEPDETEDDQAGIINFISRIFPTVSLNELGADPVGTIGSFEDLINLMSVPILTGAPTIEIGASEVTVSWATDINTNSLVAVAPEDRYSPDASEPYLQIVGNSEELITEHSVTVYNLSPDTLYHYQLRSKARFGPTARSIDYTFRTSIEELQITSFFSQIIDNETAIFKWITNKEADSTVKFAPYRGNILAIDQSKTVKDSAVSVVHEIKISEFEAGTFYDIELISVDPRGNLTSETLDRFSTSEDDLPPFISHIKADSTVFVDRGNKIQTIISWLTNEPSTSRVYYQEGVHGGDMKLAEATDLNSNYTKEHVMVITRFKPGIVYTFRAESIDSGGNISRAKPHTFMTAQKSESIIQVILRILEETFGWAKKLI